MTEIIIHISDLHVSDLSAVFGEPNNDTYLTVGNDELNYSFTNAMVEKAKTSIGEGCNVYLLITGDITELAETIEYEVAEKILNQIIDDLHIPREQILIIPGDHDVHRDSVKNALRTEQDKTKHGYEFHVDKFRNFARFYKSITGKEFLADELIFDTLTIGDIILLGVNSNFQIGQKSGEGFLPIEQFDKALINITNDNPAKQFVLGVHHNLSAAYENKVTGKWNKENRRNLISILEKHNVKLVLHGSEHTPHSGKLDATNIYVSDSGALSCKSLEGCFKIYQIIKGEKSLIVKNNVFQLRNYNMVTTPSFGDWITLSLPELKKIECEDFELINNLPMIEPPEEISALTTETDTVIELKEGELHTAIEESLVVPVSYANLAIQETLYNIVKQKKLYYSGHFHWSESSRAHNWIDVSKLLENKEDLLFVKNSIIDLIETFNLQNECDLIIGLGNEGNIISSKASIKFDIPHTSLPYSYRYEEHHQYERKLNFLNNDGSFKKVMVITDVVNDGRTVRKLIAEKEKEFFAKVQKVIVVALFYTGHRAINIDILNNNQHAESSKDLDYNVRNIDFYAIKSLRVESCPYKEDFRNKCFIYKDHLSDVHIFYDEK